MERDRTGALSSVPITLVFFLVLTVGLAVLTPPSTGEEEPGTSIEDFTLYGYPDEKGEGLSWKLIGEKANQESKGLVVQNFELTVRKSGSGDEQLLSSISGNRLRLEGEGESQVAHMPGEVNIEIQEGMEGTARELSYHLAEDEASGKELEVSQSKESGGIDLKGTDFTYNFNSEEIRISEGFEIVSNSFEGQSTEISGESLRWPPAGRIEMVGGITATLPSGWELKAEKMNWNPDQGLLESSGSAEATKEGTRIEGQAVDYDSDNEKISVFEGKLVTEEE